MTADAENTGFEHLRSMRPSRDRSEPGPGGLEFRVSVVDRDLGEMQAQLGALNHRMDRFDERLTRVEQRLDGVDV